MTDDTAGPEHDTPFYDACIRDDSTECNCSRCVGAEDRFWAEQGGADEWPMADGYDELGAGDA